jgi:hypothetical protein
LGHEQYDDQGRHANLLQELGQRAAGRLQPWLAAIRRCLDDQMPMEAFDGIRAGVLAGRSQFFKDLTVRPLVDDSNGASRAFVIAQ